MVKNVNFTTQILDKIGGPLTAVVNGAQLSQEEAAQATAQLLSQTTQLSTNLYNTLDIKEDDAQADSTRLALAVLCAPLIADSYMVAKKVPDENVIKALSKSLEAVLTYSHNFTPAADHQSRLESVHHTDILFDKDQVTLYVVQAMVPVINAITEFSFGQTRNILVKDVAEKLQAKAKDIADKNAPSDKLQELVIFKTLADIYASCHKDATQKASNANDASVVLTLDSVWENFDLKLSMIEVLLDLGTETKAASSASGATSKAPVTAAAPVAPPPVEQSPAQAAAPPVEAPVPPEPEKPAETAAPAAGPMGFFKKPTAVTETAATAPPAEPAAPEPAPPPAAEENKTDASAGPMGFFKKPKEGES